MVRLTSVLFRRAADTTFPIVPILFPNLHTVLLKLVCIPSLTTCFGISVICRLFFKRA